jgi:hypothetical protein
MRLRYYSLLAFVVLAVPVRAAEPARSPTLVVRLNSIDDMLSDVRYLAQAAGKGEEARQFEGLVKAFSGPKGLEGIDTTRPIGVYGRLDANLPQSEVVVLLPVADEQTLLALIQRVGVKTEKQGDVYKVDVPNAPFAGYFRFANGYAHVTVRDAKAIDKDRLLDPAKVLPAGHGALVEVTVDLEQVPTQLKDLVIGEFTRNLSQGKEAKKPDETDAQYKLRCAAVDEITAHAKAIVNDGKSLSIKIDINPKSDELAASIRFTPKPGTRLAESVADLGGAKSILANLSGPDTAGFARGFVAMPRELRKPFDAAIDEGMREALTREKDKRQLLELIFKAASPTLKAGELDAAMEIRGPQANGFFTGVVGFGVKEGSEVEKALRALVKELPPQLSNGITFDVAKAGEVSIHQLNVDPAMVDREVKRLCGDKPPFYFAVRNDAVLLAFGDNALELLKEVVGREPKAGRMLQIDGSVLRLSALDKDKRTAEVARKVFQNARGDDMVHITLEGGKALELRISARAKLLEFGARLDEVRKKGDQ